MVTIIEFTKLKTHIYNFLTILVTCHFFLAFFNIYSCNIQFASMYFLKWLLVVEK